MVSFVDSERRNQVGEGGVICGMLDKMLELLASFSRPNSFASRSRRYLPHPRPDLDVSAYIHIYIYGSICLFAELGNLISDVSSSVELRSS